MQWLSMMIVVLVCALSAGAVEKPATRPATGPADAAQANYEAAREAAAVDVKAAIALAVKNYSADITTAFNAAMDATNLEEANRLKAELDRVGQGSAVNASQPKGSAMIGARQKYEREIDRIHATQVRAIDAAKRQYVQELKGSIAASMKANNLDEANRIQGIIDGLQQPPVVVAPKPARPPVAKPAEPVKPPPDKDGAPRTINLLTLTDFQREAPRGKWVRTRDGVLDDTFGYWALVRIPYEPPAEYDYGMEFTVRGLLKDLTDLHVLLPHEGRWGDAYFKNHAEALSGFHGWDNNGGVGTHGPLFEVNKRYRLVIRIRTDKISAYLNDKLVSEARTESNNTEKGPPWFYTGEANLGLGTIYGAFEFHALYVQELKEQGKIVKLPPLGDVPTIEGNVPSDKPKRVVDLLRITDLRTAAINGAWVRDGTTVVSNGSTGSAKGGTGVFRVRFPYQPPEEYDYRVTFSRLGDRTRDIGLVLSHAGREFSFLLGSAENTWGGFSKVKDKDVGSDNPTSIHFPWLLASQRKYTLVVYVREDFVAASIDGKLIAKYPTDYSDLSNREDWAIGNGCLGLGEYFSRTTVHSVEVAEITGEGHPVK